MIVESELTLQENYLIGLPLIEVTTSYQKKQEGHLALLEIRCDVER